MIVIDANIVASLYLTNPHQTDVEALLATEPHWVAPGLWRSEFRNVLIQYVRHGKITLPQALTVMEYSEQVIETIAVEAPSSQIMRLSHSSNCSAYDCEYVVAASNLRTLLITFDKKLLTIFPNIAFTPKAFLTMTT